MKISIGKTKKKKGGVVWSKWNDLGFQSMSGVDIVTIVTQTERNSDSVKKILPITLVPIWHWLFLKFYWMSLTKVN